MNAAPKGRTTPFSSPQPLCLDHGWATVGLRACQARQVSQIGPRQHITNAIKEILQTSFCVFIYCFSTGLNETD